MKKKRYKYGTSDGQPIKDYLTGPNELLAQNSLNLAEAQYEAESSVGQAIGNSLASIITEFGGAIMEEAGGKAAYGGKAQVGDRIEGGEVTVDSTGKAKQHKGPKHGGEQDGIELKPEDIFPNELGVEVYSDRINVDGKSLADRKMKRERAKNKVEKGSSKDKTSAISRNTYSRTKSNNERVEKYDKTLQNIVNKMKGLNEVRKFAYGTTNKFLMSDPLTIEPMGLTEDGLIPTEEQSIIGEYVNMNKSIDNTDDSSKKSSDVYAGDVVGMAGTLYGAIAPALNTKRNRAGDTPNPNYYKDFGKDALESFSELKNAPEKIKENTKQDLKMSENADRNRARKSARSINTLRGLDSAISNSYNAEERKVQNQYFNQLMQVINQESQLEMSQDRIVMSGEEQSDIRNRKDRDAYYTNKGVDQANIAESVQKIGADLNQRERNKMIKQLADEYQMTEADLQMLMQIFKDK